MTAHMLPNLSIQLGKMILKVNEMTTIFFANVSLLVRMYRKSYCTILGIYDRRNKKLS